MSKKQRSSNAMKHGAFSRELILPGESRTEYQMLHNALDEEWMPSGPTEVELVGRLASLMWRQRRQEVYEQFKLRKRIHSVRASNKSRSDDLALRSLAPLFAAATTFKEVENIFVSNGFSCDGLRQKVPQPSADQDAKWGPAFAEYFGNLEIRERLDGVDAFAATIDPAESELDIIRSSRIQEDIDRTIKRLVQIKSYKELHSRLRPGDPSTRMIDVSSSRIADSSKDEYQDKSREQVAELTNQTTQTSSPRQCDITGAILRIK